MRMDELAEVAVLGQQDPLLGQSQPDHSFVGSGGRDFCYSQHIVAGCSQGSHY